MKERLEESTRRPSSSRVRQFKRFPMTEEFDMPEMSAPSVARKQENWVKPPLFKGKQQQANGLVALPPASLEQERETPPLPSHSVPLKRRTVPFNRLHLEGEKPTAAERVQEAIFSDDAIDDFEGHDTIPMMVLMGIAKQQGQSAPVMQSEVTGAASNAAIVGLGAISGYVFKYGNNLVLQRGLG